MTEAIVTESLTVHGMTCGGCAAAVERALKSVDGVTDVAVDLEAKQARVSFDPSRATREKLAQAIVKAGFTVPS